MDKQIIDDLIVVKRSGQRVNFNGSKIAIAIKCAFDSIYTEYDENKINKVYESVLNYINQFYHDRKTINVEDIQDIIERSLKEFKYLNVYESFSEYRQKRAISRKMFAEKQQHKFVKAIEKIAQNKDLINEKYLSPDYILSQFGKIVSGEYTKAYVLDNKFVRAHEEGNIYIHNLDYFNFGIFSKVHIKLNIESNSDCLNNIIIECLNAQKEINDEIAIDAIDYLLSSFVLGKFKKLFTKNLKNYLKVSGLLELINFKKIEELILKEENIEVDIDRYCMFNINQNLIYLFNQAKSDATEDLNDFLYEFLEKLINALNEMAINSNQFTITTGLNNNDIGKIINRNLLALLKNKEPLNNISFIFKIDNNINDEIIKLIQAKHNILIIFVNSKTRNYEYFADGTLIAENDEESITTGRLEISKTSINMARLGFKSQGKNIQEFYEELNETLELVKNELLLVFETIGDKSKDNYQVLFRGNIFEDEKLEENQKIRKVIKNGILNIGLVGLNECVNLLEKEEKKHYQLIINILTFINNKILEYNQETKLNFRVSEITDLVCRKELMAIDKTIYGKTSVTNKNFYELISELNSINTEQLVSIQKRFNGGLKIIIKYPEKVSTSKIKDTLLECSKLKATAVKINLGK